MKILFNKRSVLSLAIKILDFALTAQSKATDQEKSDTTGCGYNKQETSFLEKVIKYFGIDGEGCFESRGKKYCLSKNKEAPAPLTRRHIIGPLDNIYLCAELNGVLGGCIPTQPVMQCPENEPCWCVGERDCATLANLPGCVNGSCGDCDRGDCCCTIED